MSTVERDNESTVVQLPPEIGTAGATATVTPPAPAKEPTASADRDYVVLKREKQDSPNSPPVWTFVSNIGATSAEQAVRRAAETPGTSFLNADGPTTLVAIPARSFNPVTLTVKVETTIVLS